MQQLSAQVVALYGQGNYKQAIPLAKRALAMRKNVFGPEHQDTATSLNNLAGLYHATGAYGKAELLYLRARAIYTKVCGTSHPNTAASLGNLAELYRTTGAYAKAELLHQRERAIYTKVLGSAHPFTATSLSNLAELYRTTGAYSKAQPLCKRALAIRTKVLGATHPDTATSLSNLAALYHDTGAYAKAEPLYQRALAVCTKVIGSAHPDTATSLDNLAELYRTTGAYSKAQPLCKRALAIRTKVLGVTHPDTATSLSNLAALYHDTGAYAKAEPLYQRALAICTKALGSAHPDTAHSLGNLAEFYRTTGQYAKAEPLYQQALAICTKVLGSTHPDTAASLSNLAELYHDTGVYAKAEPLYQQALTIRTKVLGSTHPDTARSLSNLAELYHVTGAYTKAQPFHRRALVIRKKALGSAHPETAASLSNLAKHYHVTGSYAKAKPLYQQALAIYKKVLGPIHPDTAAALSNIAVLYRSTGNYTKAKLLYQQALAICTKMLSSAHPSTATSLNNLAELYRTTGAYTKAEPLYQQALTIRTKVLGSAHPDTARSLSNLAELYHTTGAYANAQPLYERAQSIRDSNTRYFLLSGSEARKHAYLHQHLGDTYVCVSISLVHPTEHSVALGLTSVLQYKGRVLDTMSDSTVRLRHRVSPENRVLFDQLTAIAQEFSTLTFRGLGNLSPKAYRKRLKILAQEQEHLQTELSSRSAELRQAFTPVTLQGLRKMLPTDSALVEWLRYAPYDPNTKWNERWGAPQYMAYILKRSGKPVAIDLGPAQPIDDLIPEFRTALSDRASTHFKEVATALFEKLITPLRPHFGQSKQLLLCPDGSLNLVPFAALVDEHGDYLLQHFELTYLTSGRDLLRMTDESKPRDSAVVLADPDYGTSPSAGPPVETAIEPTRAADLDRSGLLFKPLVGTTDEATALQSLLNLDAVHMLTRDRATEANLRKLSGPRILHLATHGFFLNDLQMKATIRHAGFSDDMGPVPLSENPLLRSGLALAGANARHSGTTDDGILTAAEAAQLDLLGTQLVVLSACETGLGTVQNGEGVYGLRRALVLAGAQAQLVSLWKVNDEATRELMVDYYKRLLAGEGRSAALRAVQQTMLANPARQHPCYWAAFIPIGNWRPLFTD